MTVAYVQGIGNAINHASSSTTGDPFGAITNIGGDCLFCLIGNFTAGGQGASAPTDTQGNTWTRQGAIQVNGSNTIEVWAAPNCKAGSNTVSTHFGSAAFYIASLIEFSGVAAASPLDVGPVSSTTTGTSHGSGSTPTTQAGDLVLGIYWDPNAGETLSISDGKTQIDSQTAAADFIDSYAIQVASATQSATFGTTTSVTGIAGVWAFLAAAPSGPSLTFWDSH